MLSSIPADSFLATSNPLGPGWSRLRLMLETVHITGEFTYVLDEAALSVSTYLINVNRDCLTDVYVPEYSVCTSPLSNSMLSRLQ
jgi:hypothetical protein